MGASFVGAQLNSVEQRSAKLKMPVRTGSPPLQQTLTWQILLRPAWEDKFPARAFLFPCRRASAALLFVLLGYAVWVAALAGRHRTRMDFRFAPASFCHARRVAKNHTTVTGRRGHDRAELLHNNFITTEPKTAPECLLK